MPTTNSNKVPTYRRHRMGDRDRAFVELDGRRTYLGTYGTRESRQRYDRLVAEWLAAGRRREVAPTDITVVEVCQQFMRHARQHYPRRGSSLLRFRVALRPLRRLYGRTLATEFGPKSLRVVRDTWIQAHLARKTVNDYTAAIKHVFGWAASQELVAGSVYQSLISLPGLRRERSGARETKPVQPVLAAHIRAIRAYVSSTIWAMIQIMRLTGMRPGEIVQMRPRDLNMTGAV